MFKTVAVSLLIAACAIFPHAASAQPQRQPFSGDPAGWISTFLMEGQENRPILYHSEMRERFIPVRYLRPIVNCTVRELNRDPPFQGRNWHDSIPLMVNRYRDRSVVGLYTQAEVSRADQLELQIYLHARECRDELVPIAHFEAALAEYERRIRRR